jgi:hypothetical protein
MEITEENLEIVIVEPPELDIGAARALVALIAAKRVSRDPIRHTSTRSDVDAVAS